MKILPLALAQFIASYAATSMNVAISTIGGDLGTTITGVQTTITLQLRWPDADQADVPGVSRAVSNLGSSFGTALVGSVLTLLVLFSVVGLGLALFIRRDGEPRRG